MGECGGQQNGTVRLGFLPGEKAWRLRGPGSHVGVGMSGFGSGSLKPGYCVF